MSEELLTHLLNQAACEVYKQALQERNNAYYQQNVGLDDLSSPAQMRTHFEKGIDDVMVRAPYVDKLEEVRKQIQIATAWRVEGTLREVAKFKPVNMWFSYPVHALDKTGVLADIQLEDVNGNNSPWKKNFDKKDTKEDKSEKVESAIYSIYDGINPVTIDDLVEYFSTESRQVSEKTVRRWIKNNGKFTIKNKEISPKNDEGQK